MTKESEDFCEACDLGHRFIDEMCSDSHGVPDKDPEIILRAAGVVVANVALAFKMPVHKALAVAAKQARELWRECKEMGEEG
jgi:hypothetical protein